MQCINKITYVHEMFTIQEIVFLSYFISLAAYSVLSIKQSGGNKQAGGRIFSFMDSAEWCHVMIFEKFW